MDLALLIAPAVLLTAKTPADSKALIKITLTTRLVVTQCYSVVKDRPALRRPTWVGWAYFCPKVGAPATCHGMTVTELYGCRY